MASDRRSGPGLQPASLLGLIVAADALRRPERLATLLHACECVVLSAPEAPADFAPARYVTAALAVAKGVAAGAIARAAARSRLPGRACGHDSEGRALGATQGAPSVETSRRVARVACTRTVRRSSAMQAPACRGCAAAKLDPVRDEPHHIRRDAHQPLTGNGRSTAPAARRPRRGAPRRRASSRQWRGSLHRRPGVAPCAR